MRLQKIKLAGFKSFVDPTTIHLPSNLMGIVGPNGCGKSNVIDAVRWVMGESSAKHLRGDSMADVIFNGSSGRKPVGQAAIELVFDNSDGTVGGQYANYNEISVRRQVSRDGQSTYFLNGTRCRRRDITDIFLGTGLGPRSYSIIEQGMISRLIEAKPEELRVYLEEAAGISKYKERRRETENRIRHTRDNLDRLNDLREEIDKQLQHLQRQAKTAEKYKNYKQEERQLKAELLALRLRQLEAEAADQDRIVQQRETSLEAVRAEQRAAEAALEKDRAAQHEVSERFNEVQGRFYAVGGEIARVEQSIQHQKDMRDKQRQDLEQLTASWHELNGQIGSDQAQVGDLREQLAAQEPALHTARAHEQECREAFTAAEQRLHDWQRGWDEFNARAALPSEAAQVQKARIDHLERHLIQLDQRSQRAAEELQHLSDHRLEEEIAQLQDQERDHAGRLEQDQQALQEINAVIAQVREGTQDAAAELDRTRSRVQQQEGRLASLEALQQAALGQSETAVVEWLTQQGLADAQRLAQAVEVEHGWERALETVLGFHLQAVCVDQLDAVAGYVGDLNTGAVTLFDSQARPASVPSPLSATALRSRVQAPWPMAGLLEGIYCAEDLTEALRLRPDLQAHESVVTRDGLWLGAAWLRLARDADAKAGVLQREHEIKELQAEMATTTAAAEALAATLERERERLHTLELEREELQGRSNEMHRKLADCRGELRAKRARLEHLTTRAERLSAEAQELAEQRAAEAQETDAARQALHQALAEMEQLSVEREELNAERERLREAFEEARSRARSARDESHRIALQVESMTSQSTSLQQNLERMLKQREALDANRGNLEQAVNDAEQPLRELEQSLEQHLSARVQVESELTAARQALEAVDEAVRSHEQQRLAAEERLQEIREALEQARLEWREFDVRRRTLQEQLDETGFAKDALLEQLPEDAAVEAWQEQVERMATRIQRLGSINLAAIDEFAEQTERKTYLDAQHADVTEALETLEEAIRKIDRETRARFKETFDKVNAGLQDKFPRVFGGGHAYLELTGEDLLDAGVAIMARPPGKRNSSIHLLSGGEKALTAVALVFSIFELNPAPFCMLDEVDAPLDDANVGRFCELVEEMSSRVQFIFITHNKGTMAMANQLTGVTMHEPGVSRLVAVDVDEAAKLAAM